MEAYYFEKTGVFPERRFWSDTDNPAEIAGTLIASYFPSAGRIAIELKAWPLSVDRHSKITSLLAGRELVDGSDIVARLRQRKSPAEIYLMRQAAKAAEAGMAKAEATAAAGITERAMAASISSALIEAGSDMQGPGVLASGERALHLHGSYTDKRIEAGETLQFEVLACVRHYHARFMRTIKIEYASDTEKVLAEQLISIQDAALAEVGPGVAATVPDRIYREGVLSRGLAERYSNKTFYGVGLLLPPSGGEGLEASPAALWSFEPGMTLHSYLLAQGFGFSETILITETGYERLTNYPRELILAAAAG
jgi:Xaa-Pro dipeptidase